MPEFPLTIRLIGLRVTKLKDLKAEAESKAAGIMKVAIFSVKTEGADSSDIVLRVCRR